jgi:hypothetical protein
MRETGYRQLEISLRRLEETLGTPTFSPADALAVAFHLVLAGQLRPDTLLRFDAEKVLERARTLAADDAEDPIAAARQALAAQQPGVEPAPLWLAWMTVTQGVALQAPRKFA